MSLSASHAHRMVPSAADLKMSPKAHVQGVNVPWLAGAMCGMASADPAKNRHPCLWISGGLGLFATELVLSVALSATWSGDGSLAEVLYQPNQITVRVLN